MKQQQEVNLEITRELLLWYYVYDGTEKEIILGDSDNLGNNASINSNYDFEEVSDGVWLFHLDTGFKYPPYFKLLTRITFYIHASESQLLNHAVLTDMVKYAFQLLQKAVDQIVVSESIILESPIDLKDIPQEGFVSQISESYFIRKSDNKANETLNQTMLNMSTGNHTKCAIQVTFVVMDLVLHTSHLFDLEANQETFEQLIPGHSYYTLKLKLKEIEEKDLSLNIKEVIFFYHLMDCTLQLLVGDYADLLLQELTKTAFNDEISKIYFSFCTNLINNLKTENASSGVRIPAMEKMYDWNSLIKTR